MIREKTLLHAIGPALLVLVVMVAPRPAHAASGTLFGPRLGISSSPDQLVLGGQVEFPEFAPHLTVDPNLELGFLDNQTVISMNVDFFYHFTIQNSQWSPYAGMGIGLNVAQFDHNVNGGSNSETNAGANVVIGASVPTRTGNRFFGELRVGLGDIPAVKLMAGWNFAM